MPRYGRLLAIVTNGVAAPSGKPHAYGSLVDLLSEQRQLKEMNSGKLSQTHQVPKQKLAVSLTSANEIQDLGIQGGGNLNSDGLRGSVCVPALNFVDFCAYMARRTKAGSI